MAVIQTEALKWMLRVWMTNISIAGNVCISSHSEYRLAGLVLSQINPWPTNDIDLAEYRMYSFY